MEHRFWSRHCALPWAHDGDHKQSLTELMAINKVHEEVYITPMRRSTKGPLRACNKKVWPSQGDQGRLPGESPL